MNFFSKNKKDVTYSDLSSKQKTKIVREATIKANEEQYTMVKEFEKSKNYCNQTNKSTSF
jgi:hypothetical protein